MTTTRSILHRTTKPDQKLLAQQQTQQLNTLLQCYIIYIVAYTYGQMISGICSITRYWWTNSENTQILHKQCNYAQPKYIH